VRSWLLALIVLIVSGCGGHNSSKMPKTKWTPPPKAGANDPPADDWKGLDVAVAGETGTAIDLVPVPHKITVFDLWAPWCKPCLMLDKQLAALVRKHAKDIAVRKLNVGDWDSPAAQRYLGDNAVLPHIEVYNADGKKLLSEGGPPAVLIADIEQVLGYPFDQDQ
jgi:thiol-disulfide isomerase/thioredoxin